MLEIEDEEIRVPLKMTRAQYAKVIADALRRRSQKCPQNSGSQMELLRAATEIEAGRLP